MASSVYDGSTWRVLDNVWVRDASEWKRALGLWAYDGGTWRKFFEPTPPTFGGTPIVTSFEDSGSGACPGNIVQYRMNGNSSAISDWDSDSWRLDLYYGVGSTSGECGSSGWFIAQSDVNVDASDGSWGGPNGNEFEEETIAVGEYIDGGGANTTYMKAQLRIIRRSDSTEVSSSATSCTFTRTTACL